MALASDTDPLRVCFDSFELNEKDARLSHKGQPVAVAPKAFAVLCALARRPGQLVTKNELLDVVWGHQHVSESVLKTVISELRATLSDDAKQPRYIETASRRGYRFIAALNVTLTHIASPPAQAPPADFTTRTEPRPMIGRQAASAQLRAAWNNAAAGRRQIFWVAGEAGIGKSTLIDNFVASLGTRRCAYGQCVEQRGAGEPYLPVLEALGALCRDDQALPSLLRAVAPTWMLQLPWLSDAAERETLRRELAGVGQDRMLREFGELLDRYTLERPLLLVTEDLHWSDHATVQLIDHMARRRGAARLMWLASFRLAEVIAAEHPLKTLRHELRLHRLCEEIVLDPFSEQEVADYIDGRFPESNVSEALVRALHERTDGLPLFVVNVIDDWAHHGVLGSGATTGVEALVPLQVPENLAGVIDRQIARLSSEERTLLEAASVYGVEFRPAALAEALERDVAWTHQMCDELARQQHWLSIAKVSRLADGALDARHEFRHALYRQVFYQRLGSMARARLHGRAAVSLEHARAAGLAVSEAELALHYELSHDLLAALRYYTEATQSALRRFAPKEAMTLVQHSLELLASCPASAQRDPCELTLYAMKGVSAAQLSGVSAIEAKHALEHAQTLLRRIPSHPLRGLVLHALGIVLLVRGEYAQARELGEHMIVLSEHGRDRVLFLSACSVLGQVHALHGANREARTWLEQGVATCEALGDDALQAAFMVDPAVTIYAALAIPLLQLGLVDAARARLDSALARARRMGEPMAQMVAAWFSALFEVRLGNVERVAAAAARLRAIAQECAIEQARGPGEWFEGWTLVRRGQPREGHRLIRTAYDRGVAQGMHSGSSEVLCYAAEALALAGDWRAAHTQLEEAMQTADRLNECVYLPQMLVLRGRIALARGDSTAARGAMRQAAQEAHERQALWPQLIALVALCELDHPAAEDFDALKQALGCLREGIDTALVAKAQALVRTGSD